MKKSSFIETKFDERRGVLWSWDSMAKELKVGREAAFHSGDPR